MNSLSLNELQQKVINSAKNKKIFLEGPFGTGKTTSAIYRIQNIVSNGVDPANILILVPQRTLAYPYQSALDRSLLPPGCQPKITTLAGLGQEIANVFWSLIASDAGFKKNDQPPHFLSIESAQYYMHKIVRPLIERGFFESVILDHNRLLSQILDNLNKSAIVGFPETEISERLNAAWVGDPTQSHIYKDCQTAASLFREFCLENNLIDYSLNIKIFCDIAWKIPECQAYLNSRYKHIIYDNIEEDTPSSHDLIENWLPNLESSLLIMDNGGGYRRFLGADPMSARRFKQLAGCCFDAQESYYGDGSMAMLANVFTDAINRKKGFPVPEIIKGKMEFSNQPYLPEMVRWVSEKVEYLIYRESVSPRDIVILAPYLSDSMRFSLIQALENKSIPLQSYRPSRSLSAEPPTLCMLTLAQLAHPNWKQIPTRFEIRNALLQSIAELDLLRADLMSQIIYSHNKEGFSLNSFERINPPMQERITFRIGQKYEKLRLWLEKYHENQSLEMDVFLSRLFGEILSQPGFGFHRNYRNAGVAARLIASAANFRKLPTAGGGTNQDADFREFINLFHEGIIGSQYLIRENESNQNAVFIAPAYTFLMLNRPVRIQFWLDISSMGWWKRINQPLTHPVVLSRNWISGVPWTDADEYSFNQTTLQQVVSGLLLRCTDKLFLCASGINQSGDEERGPLLQAIQRINMAMIHPDAGAG